jgi:hypothetical protein
MKNDFIIKGGSYGKNFYIMLDGEATMVGFNTDIIGIMGRGCHFSNDLLPKDDDNYHNKRIVHIVAKTLSVVGVIQKSDI